MGVSKRDPINRLPFTPLATDVFVRETHNVVRPVNDPIPEFGTPHDAISKAESWPHHRFCWQTEINPQGDCERWFVATPESQHLYNWQFTDSPDWPVIRQVFVTPREDFDPDFTAYAAPPSDILDLTDYEVTAIEQTRIGEKQLDSLFVSVTVTREKITSNPKIGSVLDPQTNTLRQVLIEKVPAGTPGTTVDTNGQYSEVQPINTLWALKTTQFMAGLAGNGDGATQSWSDVLNYSWPDVLLGFDFFSFPSSSGSVDSVTGRPIWKRQRYDGPCEATITEKWTLNPPTPPSFTPMLAREIEYRSPLMSVSTPPCLHPTVVLWDTPGSNHPSLGFYVYAQTYEATSLTDWPATYVASFTVRPAAGGYLSRLVEVNRPDGVLYDNVLELNSPTPGTAVNSVNISWSLLNQNGTLSGYRLDVNTKADFTGTFLTGFNNLNVGTATSYTITGMSPATQYFVRVRASLTSPTGSATSNTQIAVAEPVAAFTLTDLSGPTVVPDGGTLAYGNATVSSTDVTKTLRITNTGNLALTGFTRTLGGTNSNQWTAGTLSSASLSAGGTRDFTLDFSPTATGAKVATVQIAPTNGSAQTLNLTGTGIWVLAVNDLTAGAPISNNGTMPTTIVIDNTPYPLEAVNPSSDALPISSAVWSGPDAAVFAVGGLGSSVAGGSSQAFEVSVLTGTGSGTYTADLTITHGGTNSPFTFTVNAVIP
jgi:hypothetical protein